VADFPHLVTWLVEELVSGHSQTVSIQPKSPRFFDQRVGINTLAELLRTVGRVSEYEVTFSDWGEPIDSKTIPIDIFAVVNSGNGIENKINDGYAQSGAAGLLDVGAAAVDFMRSFIGH